DADGELLAAPISWKEETPPPRIICAPGKGRPGAALGVGDRALARLNPIEGGAFEARIIKRLGQSAHQILGLYRRTGAGGGRIEPVDRRSKKELAVSKDDALDAADGDLVVVEMLPDRAYGLKRAKVKDIVGRIDDQRAISLIAVHSHGVPVGFSEDELAEAEAARLPELGVRTDLRDVPLLTVDPADARDHDDAVWAGPDDNPKNKGGWVVIVAIADVAAFVRPGGALDKGAQTRGNSCYLPDRVIPMLPERLSTDLCSLREGEERPCLAVRMVFDAQGVKRDHTFLRGLMRSAAKLSYEDAQSAADGAPTAAAAPWAEKALQPLFAAYRAVAKARDARAPLDLDMPERKIVLDKAGFVDEIALRERFDAHRLIEEFMIQANVAAAETLEAARTPLIYRVHDGPADDKMEALRSYLESVGYAWPKGGVVRAANFNAALAKARERDEAEMIGEVILRCQSQAVYAVDNLGHFGLNLRRYAHFTSPIRRYADLTVHRSLISAAGLGDDGLSDAEAEALAATADAISKHERRAMAAERDSVDRYVAAFLQDRIGAEFAARISGVTRFGLFVRLDDTGADGLVPVRSLGLEYFEHDETRHALVGELTGSTYRLGQKVRVRLEEATPLTGGLRFEMLTDPEPGDGASKKRRRRGPKPRGPAKPAKGKGGPRRKPR
ncbi:MAG: ribonuclease R, partial [Pseudomonadota bacterium]